MRERKEIKESGVEKNRRRVCFFFILQSSKNHSRNAGQISEDERVSSSGSSSGSVDGGSSAGSRGDLGNDE